MENHENHAEYIRKVALVRDVIQGKWTLQILCAMRPGPVRLSRLVRLLPAASKKSLRANLRSLEKAGIILRRDMSRAVLHVEYDFELDMRDAVCALMDDLANRSDAFTPSHFSR